MNVFTEDFDVSATLTNDPEGHGLRGVKDALEEMKSDIRKKIDKGLPPNEYIVASNLQKAYQTAQDLVDQFWSQPRK